jgi:hypothetical protein
MALEGLLLLELTDEVSEALGRDDTTIETCDATGECTLSFIVGQYLNQHGWPTSVQGDALEGNE